MGMSVTHVCSKGCIRADGSYCRELEAAIGIRPHIDCQSGETLLDPDTITVSVWDDPTADAAIG